MKNWNDLRGHGKTRRRLRIEEKIATASEVQENRHVTENIDLGQNQGTVITKNQKTTKMAASAAREARHVKVEIVFVPHLQTVTKARHVEVILVPNLLHQNVPKLAASVAREVRHDRIEIVLVPCRPH